MTDDRDQPAVKTRLKCIIDQFLEQRTGANYTTIRPNTLWRTKRKLRSQRFPSCQPGFRTAANLLFFPIVIAALHTLFRIDLMGVMRFQIPPSVFPDGWPEAHRAYISGFGGNVFPTQVEIEGDLMVCRRQTAESGKLHVAWPIAGFGRPVVSTGSLCEREEHYLLAVELARGQIAQIRDQLGNWELSGMSRPAQFDATHGEAYHLFSRAVAVQDDPDQAVQLACDSLVRASQAGEMLTKSYGEQRLGFRRNRSAQLPASLGCSLGHEVPDAVTEESFCEAFNAAMVPIDWRDIEPREGEYDWTTSDRQIQWCQQNKLLIHGGPLLDLAPQGLPKWLWQWEHDFHNLQSFVCNFIETALSRYFGITRNWEISARVNTGGALTISEQDRLALVARSLETARQVDEEIQLMVRVDEPWGSYQARGQHRLSPMQFVDALMRANVGLTGVNLEIAVGYRPRGSASRGLLEFSQLIDRWNALGIPLSVTLAFPSDSVADPMSNPDLEVEEESWKNPWGEQTQAEWIDLYLPILMAKDAVVGIYWAHFSDSHPHDFPHAGLVRSNRTPKPGLEHIIKYRRTYWQPQE